MSGKTLESLGSKFMNLVSFFQGQPPLLGWRGRGGVEVWCQACHQAVHSGLPMHVGGGGHYQLYNLLHTDQYLPVSGEEFV